MGFPFDTLRKQGDHAVKMALAIGRTLLGRAKERGGSAPPAPLPKAEARDYTREELRTFDGRDPTRPLLLAVRGKVYDVTRGRAFYGPGGPYEGFAGRDCTRALAKLSLEPEDFDASEEGLTPSELAKLEEWIETFEEKYGSIGSLV